MPSFARTPQLPLAAALLIAGVFSLLLPSPGRAQCAPSSLFAPHVLYGAGNYPVEPVSADINGDGVLDLLVTNWNGGSLTILLGSGSAGVGDGTFGPATTLALGDNPRSIAKGHFNADASVDFAVPIFGDDEIAILLGNGSGGFSTSFLASSNQPRFVTTGDFNADGITDLAVTFSGDDQVGVYLGHGSGGTGNGSFAAVVTYATGNHPWGIAAADFDEDGITDLAVTNALGGSISVFPGSGTGGIGDGSFLAPTVYSEGIIGPRGLLAADFDEDGLNDLAIVSLDDGAVYTMIGRGAAGFELPVSYGVGTNPAELAVGDLNQDGILDLAVGVNSDDVVVVMLGNGVEGLGDGTFGTIVSLTSGSVPAGVEIADFNEDGHPDMAVPNALSDNVSVYLNICDVPPPPCDPLKQFNVGIGYPTGTNAIDVAVADFNEDGFQDAVVANFEDGVSVLLGTGSGGVPDGLFELSATYEAGDGPRGVAIGDFDGDDILDFAVANLNDGSLSVFQGNGSDGVGSGAFASQLILSVGSDARSVASGDFNGDGLADVAVTLSEIDQIAVLLANGNGFAGSPFATPVYYATNVFPYGILVEDFDQDGISDLAVTSALADVVSIFVGQGSAGTGDGTFVATTDVSVGSILRNMATGDFNEDGHPDLAVVADGVPRVHVLMGQGNGNFDPPQEYRVGPNPENVAVADFNQDGTLDLAVPDTNNDEVLVLYGFGAGGVGDGTFSTPLAHPTGSGPSAIVAADVDADGYPDVLNTNFFGHSISVLPNCGHAPPLPPPPPPPPPSPEPQLISVRDVPNDDGGFVFVSWLRSALDVGPDMLIHGYRVWRRIPPASVRPEWSASGGAPLPGSIHVTKAVRRDGVTDLAFWEAIADLPAQRLPGYGFTATTPQDSMRRSNPYTAFFITALTGDPFVFHSSNVDSGYSVDNIKPNQPSGFEADYGNDEVALSWETSREADFEAYLLYRGDDLAFGPSDENRIAVLEEPGYIDRHGSILSVYKLVAVDEHENHSDVAVVAAPEAVRVGPGTLALALRGAVPNPTRAGLQVVFTLPTSAPASLALIDLSGRLIRDVDVARLGPGTHHIDLANGFDLPNGVFWVRLDQAGKSRSRKAVVLK